MSDQGVAHRTQRPFDVEAVFENIKKNKGITRFMLRGKDNVLIEAGLIALAHNLAKMGINQAPKLIFYSSSILRPPHIIIILIKTLLNRGEPRTK